MGPPIDLAGERAALAEARDAVEAKLDRLSGITAVGADEYTEGFIDAVVATTMHQLQQELTVFGRIDDDHRDPRVAPQVPQLLPALDQAEAEHPGLPQEPQRCRLRFAAGADGGHEGDRAGVEQPDELGRHGHRHHVDRRRPLVRPIADRLTRP